QPRPHRPRGPRGAGGQPLPLHRLPQHRPGGPRGGPDRTVGRPGAAGPGDAGMIPSPFEYLRARSVDEALAALAEQGEDAKLLAGGPSLLPIMKLRLAIPTVLIDIGSIAELSYVRVDGSGP